MGACLLRIIQSEQPSAGGMSYEEVLRFLWENGVPGATVRRCDLGLDGAGAQHAQVGEDVSFDNMSVTTETVVDRAVAERLSAMLGERLQEGQVTLLDGCMQSVDAGRTAPIEGIDPGRNYVVKVFTKENEELFRKSAHQRIMDFLQENGITWATATRGIVGYGRDRVVHEQKVFSLSRNTPIIVEFITTGDRLPSLLERLDQLVVEGAVLTLPVDVVFDA